MSIQARRRWPSIFVIVASLVIPDFAAADDVRIRSTVANVRAEGSAQARVLFQVKAGEVLRVMAVVGDWFHVETADGRRGYVSKTVADVIPSTTAPQTAAPAAPPPRPAAGTGGSLAIDHKEVACIVGDRYPRLDACFQPAGDLGNAKVNFRAGDQGPWYAVDLMPEGSCHIAYLPKPLETTREIQYYVAAVDKAFNERQQPETAPDAAYRARVVRNQGECDRLKAVAASVQKLAKPIVVAAARTGAGAPAVLGALLVGFSQEGVILASAAAVGAAGAGGAAAAGAGAGGWVGRRHRHEHAGHRGRRGGGGGPRGRGRGRRRRRAVLQRDRDRPRHPGRDRGRGRGYDLQRRVLPVRPVGPPLVCRRGLREQLHRVLRALRRETLHLRTARELRHGRRRRDHRPELLPERRAAGDAGLPVND